MNSTASPRPSVALGQATKFIRVLENGGVTPGDLQRAIDDPDFRRKIIEAFGHVAKVADFDLSVDFRQDGVERLINRLYDKYTRSIKSSKHTRAAAEHGIEKYLDRYRSSDAVKQLLAVLTPLQLHVVALTFGLVDGVALDETEVSQRLEITVWKVKNNLGHALGVMWNRDPQIANPAPFEPLFLDTPIEDMSLNNINIRAYHALKRTGIHVLADLIRLSVEDLLHLGFSAEMLDRVETVLEAHSLKLKS